MFVCVCLLAPTHLLFISNPITVCLGSHCSAETSQLRGTSGIHIAKFSGNLFLEAFHTIKLLKVSMTPGILLVPLVTSSQTLFRVSSFLCFLNIYVS